MRQAVKGSHYSIASLEAFEFAQALLGRPLPDPSAAARESLAQQEQAQWLAEITGLREGFWDPAKHPRGGFSENPGRFSHSWGGGAAGSDGGRSGKTRRESPFQFVSNKEERAGSNGLTPTEDKRRRDLMSKRSLNEQEQKDLEALRDKMQRELAAKRLLKPSDLETINNLLDLAAKIGDEAGWGKMFEWTGKLLEMSIAQLNEIAENRYQKYKEYRDANKGIEQFDALGVLPADPERQEQYRLRYDLDKMKEQLARRKAVRAGHK
jgi:hypothetical protein